MNDKLKEALDAVAELGRLQGRVIALEALLDSEKAENARLKAEVKDLKTQPDPLTAYLYAAELAKDEIKRLKAEVNELADGLKLASEVGIKMADEVTRLKAEVERLTERNKYLEQIDSYLQDGINIANEERCIQLEAQVERLTKAGDAMAEQLDGLSFDSVWDFWNAAKEGKQS
jgi:HAMP domain-containing protein